MSAQLSFAELLVSFAIVLGGIFALVGSWGLVRLPSLMERLHGPTKATTLGLGAMLIGSILWFQLIKGEWTTHELLVTMFLFLTAPISANLIAKVHLLRMRQGAPEEVVGPAGQPPAPTDDVEWATFEVPHEGSAGDMTGD